MPENSVSSSWAKALKNVSPGLLGGARPEHLVPRMWLDLREFEPQPYRGQRVLEGAQHRLENWKILEETN